jgi:hypothetical protein
MSDLMTPAERRELTEGRASTAEMLDDLITDCQRLMTDPTIDADVAYAVTLAILTGGGVRFNTAASMLADAIVRAATTTNPLAGTLAWAAEEYRRCIVSARASCDGGHYEKCNGRAEAYRQLADRAAAAAGLPAPDWDAIRAAVPADGVYRSESTARGPFDDTSYDLGDMGGSSTLAARGLEPESGRPEGTARGTHNLPGMHG